MTATSSPGIPRGVRNNNPLNIKRSPIAWEGKSALQPDAVFETFDSPHYGIRAAARNLLTHYQRDQNNTVQEIVTTWAPPSDDNNTAAYIDHVCKKMGVLPDTELNLFDEATLTALVTAMMQMEIGAIPYSPATIRTAVAAAYQGKVGANPSKPAPAPQPIPAPAPPAAPSERPLPPLVDQPTSEPSRKVKAAPIGALAAIPLAWIVKALWDHFLPAQPMEAEVAITTAGFISAGFAYLSAYYTRNRATITYAQPYPPPPPYDVMYGARAWPQQPPAPYQPPQQE